MIYFTSRSIGPFIKKAVTYRPCKELICWVNTGYSGLNCDGKNSDVADLAVIGLGPSGIFACLRAIENGIKHVVAVDRRPAMGGTCVNLGCIPSKSLINFAHHYDQVECGFFASQGIQTSDVKLDLEKMMCAKLKVMSDLSKFLENVFQSLGIKIVRGTARFTGCKQLTVQKNDGSIKIVEANNIIIATGSAVQPSDIEVDEKQIVSSEGAMSLKTVPKNLVVIGAGIIAIELGFMWAKLGSKVTIITHESFIGSPIIDKDVRCKYQNIMEEQGLKFMTEIKVLCVRKCEKRVKIEIEDHRGENRQEMLCDVLFVSTGRIPYTTGLNLDRVGIGTNKRGHIPVHHNFQTCTPNIFAVGDVAPGPMTAHKAIEEGMLCVDGLCGLPTYLDINNLPMAIHTYPALASIGKTEEQLQQECMPFKVRWAHMESNVRARIGMDTRGCVKALICPKTNHILGVHAIAVNAGEIINDIVLAKQYGITADKVAKLMYIHPSYAKIFKSVFGR